MHAIVSYKLVCIGYIYNDLKLLNLVRIIDLTSIFFVQTKWEMCVI